MEAVAALELCGVRAGGRARVRIPNRRGEAEAVLRHSGVGLCGDRAGVADGRRCAYEAGSARTDEAIRVKRNADSELSRHQDFGDAVLGQELAVALPPRKDPLDAAVGKG